MTRYSFDGFELDERTRELRGSDAVLPIQPKAFDVLAYLIRHRDRVVPKNELLDTLWPDEVVTESSLSFCISRIRKLLDDDGAQQRRIKSFRGTGYRFIAPLLEDAAAVPAAVSPDAAATPVDPSPTDDAVPSVFVGRTAELAAFRGFLEETRRGHGRVVLLSGEAGIGKTTFLAQMAVAAQALGMRVVRGACHDPEGSVPFWPWVEVVRALVQTPSVAEVRQWLGPAAADLATVLPSLRDRVPEVAPLASVEPELSRVRLFDAFRSVLWRAARSAPLFIVLDDLHWADASTLTLLRHLAAEVDGAPILLAASHRDTEIAEGAALTTAVNELRRLSHVHAMRLGPLSRDEISTFLERKYWALSLSPRVIDECRSRSGGNPYFLDALCDHWRRLRDSDPVGAIRNLPSGLQGLLRQRLQRLPERDRRVLTVAAAIGGQFRGATLERALVGEVDEDSILACLETAMRADWVVESDTQPGTWRFVHAILRELLLGDLSAMRRMRLHRRIADALVAEADAGDEVAPGEIAQQFALAAVDGRVDQAIEHLTRAARAAGDQYAFGERVRFLSQALALLDLATEPQPKVRLQLLLALADALYDHDCTDASRATALEAAALARQIDDPVGLAWAAIHAVWPRVRLALDPDPPLALVREAEAALGDGDTWCKAHLLSRHAMALSQMGAAADEVSQRFDEALRLMRTTGDRKGLLVLTGESLLGMSSFLPAERILPLAEELHRLDEGELLTSHWVTAQRARVFGYLERGDVAAAAAVAEAYAQRAQRFRIPAAQWNAGVLQATCAFVMGDVERAEAASAEAFASAQKGGVDSSLSFACRTVQQAMLLQATADRGAIDPIVTFIADMPDALGLWRALQVEGRCLGPARDEARQVFLELVADDLARLPADDPRKDLHSWIGMMLALANTCVWLQEEPVAPRLYEALRHRAGTWATTFWGVACLGPVDRALGALASLHGERDAAEAHFKVALGHPGLKSAPFHAAWTQVDAADALRRSGRKRDVERATQLRQQGLDGLRRCGAGALWMHYAG